MFYREAGQIKTNHVDDMAIFPIRQDRIGFFVIMAIAIVAIPSLASTYILEAFMIPLLIWGLAAMSLNIMLGYAGQLSLGHGGFMAVGAYGAYNFATRIPELNIIVCFILAGLCTAAVGVFFAAYLMLKPLLVDAAGSRQLRLSRGKAHGLPLNLVPLVGSN